MMECRYDCGYTGRQPGLRTHENTCRARFAGNPVNSVNLDPIQDMNLKIGACVCFGFVGTALMGFVAIIFNQMFGMPVGQVLQRVQTDCVINDEGL